MPAIALAATEELGPETEMPTFVEAQSDIIIRCSITVCVQQIKMMSRWPAVELVLRNSCFTVERLQHVVLGFAWWVRHWCQLKIAALA